MQRFNISLSDELHSYFKTESERTGVSMSALMVIALQTYVDERNALNFMKDMPNIISFIEEYNQLKNKYDEIKNNENK